jgi:hypothetical protein
MIYEVKVFQMNIDNEPMLLIPLPKDWVRQHNIKEGDIIGLRDNAELERLNLPESKEQDK